MISLISAILISLFFTSAEAAKLQKKIDSCIDFSHYFKFRSAYLGLFIIQKNINVNTTLANQTVIVPGDSKVYVNTFTTNQGLLAGQTSTLKTPLECVVLFACVCAGTKCDTHVTTIGAQCSDDIGGEGTESDPYVFNFN